MGLEEQSYNILQIFYPLIPSIYIYIYSTGNITIIITTSNNNLYGSMWNTRCSLKSILTMTRTIHDQPEIHYLHGYQFPLGPQYHFKNKPIIIFYFHLATINDSVNTRKY